MKRRNLVRLLVGVGIGIPITVELLTFTGLIEAEFLGTDEGGGDGADTPQDTGATVEDEILPDTPQTERITALSHRIGPQSRFRLAIAVENQGSARYRLDVDGVRFDGDRVVTEPVEGAARLVLEGGESGELAATWPVPEGGEPTALDLSVERGGETSTARVRLGKVPAIRAG